MSSELDEVFRQLERIHRTLDFLLAVVFIAAFIFFGKYWISLINSTTPTATATSTPTPTMTPTPIQTATWVFMTAEAQATPQR